MSTQVRTGLQQEPRQKMQMESSLRQEAFTEGGRRCCISNIAWTIVMLPSRLLYFPSVGKALPHICTASQAVRAIFFF